jgi:hypothetical protein
MKLFNRLRRNLRGSILTAFSLLLLFSFALVFMFFNIAVAQYVRRNAVAELDEARVLYDYYGRFTGGARSGLFGRQIDHFYADGDFGHPYRLPYDYVEGTGTVSATAQAIADTLRQSGAVPNQLDNRRLRTADGGHFYVTAQPAHDGYAGWYAVFYVDITEVTRFTGRLNTLLLLLVGFVWAVAMIAITFLAGSLARARATSPPTRNCSPTRNSRPSTKA